MYMCRLCASAPVYVLKLRTVVVVIYRSFVSSIKLKNCPQSRIKVRLTALPRHVR